MRTQLRLEGIIFILFGMLLVLLAISGPITNLFGGVLSGVLLVLALISGIMGVALSLSKDHSN